MLDHSSFHCNVCDKKGKTCPCERKKQRAARGRPNGGRPQRTGARAQNAPLESMIASLSEKVNDLVQKGEEQKKTLSDGQEEPPMAQRKETRFFDEDEIGDGGLEFIGMFEVDDDRLKRNNTVGEEGGEPHEPEHPVTEHQFGSEFDDQMMLKMKETPTKGDRGTMRDNATEQPLLSDIERMMASIAKLESEEKAADPKE